MPSSRDHGPEDERSEPRRIRNIRNSVQAAFTGTRRSEVAEIGEISSNEMVDNRRSLDEPKTPRFTITMPNLPSTRLAIPYLQSSSAANRHSRPDSDSYLPSEPSLNASSAPSNPSITPSRPMSPETLREPQHAQMPEPAVTRDDRRRNKQERRNRRNMSGGPQPHTQPHTISFGPEEQELADMAAQGRRRRERRKRRPTYRGRTRSSSATSSLALSSASPSQDLIRRKRAAVNSKIVSCIGSGVFLTLLLCIYLALALTNKIASQEFHVIVILLILVTTVFFCHSLVRLCVLLLRPASEFAPDTPATYTVNQGFARGCANPSQPIRVQLLRDEEAAGIESDVTKFPPPAYGLWRESVRVDPNRIFWARNEDGAPEVPDIPEQHRPEGGDADSIEMTTTANRPPSYISEDGVDYVVEARGRSIAPPEFEDVAVEHANEVSRGRGLSLSNARQVMRDRTTRET